MTGTVPGVQRPWWHLLTWRRHQPHLPLLGDAAAGRLLPIHAMHSIGETMFAVSLAGSLFFSVSLDAARPRIVLYLAITLAPFAVLAPLVGQVVDRMRGGHRVVLMTTLAARMVLALLLADQLLGLLFYPEAFMMLVLAKSYTVSRNSIVPVLVEDRDHLVVVNSRLARTGTLAGGVAAPFAVLILQTTDAGWVLRAGSVAYGLGALLAARLAPAHPEPSAAPVVEITELAGPGVRTASVGMAAVRAAIGFSLFHIGFQLKRIGEPEWVFAALAVINGVGGFVGTFVAPRLRRMISGQAMMTAALALPAAVALFTSLRFHRVTVAAFVCALGLCGSVARRAFDGVIQTEAPHARRGRAYARLETGLELAWVLGALVAVVARAADWVGTALLALWFGGFVIFRLADLRGAARLGTEVGPRTLPLRLLQTAEALAARGDHEQAALVAVAAADAAQLVGAEPGEELTELRELGRAAVSDDADAADQALDLARQLVTDAYPPPSSGTGDRGDPESNG